MNNLTEVLAKLNKVEWTESQRGKSIKGEFMNSEFEVTFRLEQNNILSLQSSLPITCDIFVRIDNVHAFRWGCEDNDEIAKFQKWFLQTESKADEVSRLARDVEESRVKNLFEMM